MASSSIRERTAAEQGPKWVNRGRRKAVSFVVRLEQMLLDGTADNRASHRVESSPIQDPEPIDGLYDLGGSPVRGGGHVR